MFKLSVNQLKRMQITTFEIRFKRALNWHKCQSQLTMQEPNPYLDYLID